jgi:hypothetical protein
VTKGSELGIRWQRPYLRRDFLTSEPYQDRRRSLWWGPCFALRRQPQELVWQHVAERQAAQAQALLWESGAALQEEQPPPRPHAREHHDPRVSTMERPLHRGNDRNTARSHSRKPLNQTSSL